MSKVYGRLINIVKTRNSAPITATKNANRQHQPDYPITLKDLQYEVDLEKLASKFKQKAIDCTRFRKGTKIYDYTIGRLADAKRFSLIEDILEIHKEFKNITHEGFAVRIINLYGRAGMFDHARKLFDEMPELKCERTIMSFNALLSAGVKSKRFTEVCEIFREYPSKLSMSVDVFSYNTVIHALCEMESLGEAMVMFEEMKKKGLWPSVVTFNTLLDAFYKKRGFLGGERLWAMMDEDNVSRNTRSYNLTLEALVRQGELSTAVILVDVLTSEGLEPNVTTYNIFINGFCDHGDFKEAKKWYNALLESGEKPNKATFTALVPYLCRTGDCELAFDLSKRMFKRQFVVDEALLQLVVDELVKKSLIEKAEELVELGKSNNYVQYSLTVPSETDS